MREGMRKGLHAVGISLHVAGGREGEREEGSSGVKAALYYNVSVGKAVFDRGRG